MKLFTRLGNSILDRLAPETSAAAASPCTYGCNGYIRQTTCGGATLYVRCCNRYDDCSIWYNCGPQCA
ncbi:hypothetical protein [Streptomyces tanashiensis]|jgi:hypothetical protein|uniref:Chitin-binding type-1 domain-containing protein n=1 Tax=Streptomyces tanashiensis TaxID=67367 RepID=A0ABY6QVS7_9ACTN|nr:hypothetical protein [Streptomyces tanashiensis]UZX21896.1 hypothetical protein LDH80_14720 [Streptomyces tanashiensis]GGY03500.1 hypothetical protein GCM10010299_02990 [Streptomyces tanashiensis]